MIGQKKRYPNTTRENILGGNQERIPCFFLSNVSKIDVTSRLRDEAEIVGKANESDDRQTLSLQKKRWKRGDKTENGN